jgi:hypothetical protein
MMEDDLSDIHQMAQVYQFDFGDGKVYTPSDAERAMLEDFGNFILSEAVENPPPTIGPFMRGKRSGQIEGLREAALIAKQLNGWGSDCGRGGHAEHIAQIILSRAEDFDLAPDGLVPLDSHPHPNGVV